MESHYFIFEVFFINLFFVFLLYFLHSYSSLSLLIFLSFLINSFSSFHLSIPLSPFLYPLFLFLFSFINSSSFLPLFLNCLSIACSFLSILFPSLFDHFLSSNIEFKTNCNIVWFKKKLWNRVISSLKSSSSIFSLSSFNIFFILILIYQFFFFLPFFYQFLFLPSFILFLLSFINSSSFFSSSIPLPLFLSFSIDYFWLLIVCFFLFCQFFFLLSLITFFPSNIEF